MIELAALLGLGLVALIYSIEVLSPIPMSPSVRLLLFLSMSAGASLWFGENVREVLPIAAGTFGVAVIGHALLGAIIAWGDAHRVEAMRILSSGSRRP